MATSTEFLRYRTGEALMVWPPVQRVKKLCIASGARLIFEQEKFGPISPFFACFKPFGLLFGSRTIKGSYFDRRMLEKGFFRVRSFSILSGFEFRRTFERSKCFPPDEESDRKSGLRFRYFRRRAVVSDHSVAADPSARYFPGKIYLCTVRVSGRTTE